MSVFVESSIEFDFSQALSSQKFDDLNAVLGSVDFVVLDSAGQLWVEVKSWAKNVIPAHRRGGQRRSFVAKMKSKEFPKELRTKFTGTCTYLTLTDNPPKEPICYVMFLESLPLDSALRTRLMDRMKNNLRANPAKSPWVYPISVAVLDVAEWNARLTEYPARLI